MRYLLAAALLLAPLPAAAQDWYRIVKVGDATWYVDAASITKNGQWTNARKIGIYDAADDDGTKSVAFEAEFDCAARKERFVNFTSFKSDRTASGPFAAPDGGKLHDLKPNTAFGFIGDFVCNVDRKGAVRVADPYSDKP